MALARTVGTPEGADVLVEGAIVLHDFGHTAPPFSSELGLLCATPAPQLFLHSAAVTYTWGSDLPYILVCINLDVSINVWYVLKAACRRTTDLEIWFIKVIQQTDNINAQIAKTQQGLWLTERRYGRGSEWS